MIQYINLINLIKIMCIEAVPAARNRNVRPAHVRRPNVNLVNQYIY